jgi:hypothetical protein
MLLSLGMYLAILKWRGPVAALTTWTSWDAGIPFRPSWVWVYLFPYALAPALGGILSADTFRWYIGRGLFVVLLSVVIFAAVPTKTVRHSASELGDGLTAELYRRMITIDEPPANAAPSLHVSLTCLMAWAVVRDYPRWWPVAFTAAMLVWLATLLTWQHHLLDVTSGIALGSAAALSAPGMGRRRHLEESSPVHNEANANRIN